MPGLKSWILGMFGLRDELPVEPESIESAQPAESKPQPAAVVAVQPLALVSAESAGTQPPADDQQIAQRARLAAETLMENESLMADLESPAAQVLLDWGIHCARQAAASSAGLEAAAAEEAMAARMQATRQMMKAINRWVGRAGEADVEADAHMLEKIAEYAVLAYGGRFTALSTSRMQEILREVEPFRQQPDQWIASLRRSLEPRAPGQE